MTDTLVFSHANGFPLPVYRRLLDALRPEFEAVGVPRFGHDPSRPATTDWPYLVDELVEYVNALPAPNGRLWLIGHSLGGYLSVLAAERLRSRVAGIVMLDSPVIVGPRAALLRLGRAFGLDRWVMPLRQTLQRRKHWPDIDAAYAHYAAKPAFARWHPGMLRDYAEYGTVADGRGGRELFFDRAVEYRIYRSLPTSRVADVGARLDAPVAFVGGRASRELRHVGLSATRALVGERLYWVDGGHLFPMESPDATASRIRSAIAVMRGPHDRTNDGASESETPTPNIAVHSARRPMRRRE